MLGFYPRDVRIYEQALLHKSIFMLSKRGHQINNERLEFLGDAILNAIITDILYTHFENKEEGFLTNTRSKIVQREALNKLAMEIGLDKLIKSSAHSSLHNTYNMYGNAFEAFVGAIYIDQGYKRCKKFIEQRMMKPYIDLEQLARKDVNFKSKLIEWCQKKKVEISFELIEQFFDDQSNPIFQTEVLIEGLSAGTGSGYSKKESQQNAAQKALKKIKKSHDFVATVFEIKSQKEETSLEQQPEIENITEKEKADI